jgi:DNA-binding NtrC family response regulator
MSERILLVDDEEDFLETLAERMRTRGMLVTTSSSAVDALARIDKESYDAIVLDLLMPDMDGLQALKAMKASKPELQVILLTGHATVQTGVEAMKLGAVEFLEKPAEIEVLMEKIKTAHAQKMILVEKRNEEKIRKIMTEKAW